MLIPLQDIQPEHIASICDHTFLNRSECFKRENGESAVSLREKAFRSFLENTLQSRYQPYAVCVRPEDVPFTHSFFEVQKRTDFTIASVAGFPDGSWYTIDFKAAETHLALDNGAKEIDMVINYDYLKENGLDYVRGKLQVIQKIANVYSALVKVILETSELTQEQIIQACKIADEEGLAFVKTSTGFGKYGAIPEEVALMRKHFPRGIKAAGGITIERVVSLIEAMSGRKDGLIEINPEKIRIGESGLLNQLNELYHP